MEGVRGGERPALRDGWNLRVPKLGCLLSFALTRTFATAGKSIIPIPQTAMPELSLRNHPVLAPICTEFT